MYKKKFMNISRLRVFVIFTLLLCILNLQNISRLLGLWKCYNYSNSNHEQSEANNWLDDVVLSDRQPQFGRSIFYLETSRATKLFPLIPPTQTNSTVRNESEVKLNARQACAIESAALMNPNSDVFVLFAGDNLHINVTDRSVLAAIMSYANVHLRKLNLRTYSVGTPIHEWLQTGKLLESDYPIEHVSDLLRLLALWRWGGTYLDLDVVILKSLENIPSNFAGAESDNLIANSIMNFAVDGFGHEIVEMCLRDFQEHFDGKSWTHNGPEIITRVLQKICQTQSVQNMTIGGCKNFTIFPKESFFAIYYPIWEYFFEPKYLNETMERIQDSLLVHIWNKLSSKRRVKVGSSVAYGKLAEKYCPKVYASCGEWF